MDERMMEKTGAFLRPSIRASRIWRPVDDTRSAPRITSVTPCRTSSTVTANWYVQWPSRSRTSRSPHCSAGVCVWRPSSASSKTSTPSAQLHTNSATVPLARVPDRDSARRSARRRCLFASSRMRRRGVDSRSRSSACSYTDGVVALPEQRLEAERRARSQARPRSSSKATLVLRPAADAIVILDAQQDASTERARHAPHVDRVDDVPEVKVAGRRRREAGERGRAECGRQAVRDRDKQSDR